MLTEVGQKNLEQFRLEAKKLLDASLAKPQDSGQMLKAKTSTADRVTIGEEKAEGVVYDASMKEVGLESKYVLLRRLVVSTLQEQGVAYQVATGTGEIDISSLSPEQAQELVADDGYFGVEQTSERIFQFAISLAGNDASRIEQVRQGIETGFKQAEEIWGGSLPEISYQTMDAVMAKLDEWSAGVSTGG
ncbi:MAG: hypothetical protein A2521_14830 [Deltaproteobacteria bacterium RIFOXYD12_FULL_57_12]|nr:MAG: hypothetical protein A2521_14830 [Deltaproteobacteria bacterium RIFOXYD12_FULL_57_12]